MSLPTRQPSGRISASAPHDAINGGHNRLLLLCAFKRAKPAVVAGFDITKSPDAATDMAGEPERRHITRLTLRLSRLTSRQGWRR